MIEVDGVETEYKSQSDLITEGLGVSKNTLVNYLKRVDEYDNFNKGVKVAFKAKNKHNKEVTIYKN